jgi:hypothetical protein
MNSNIKQALPTILTFVSAAGLIGTTVLAVKATPKAVEKIKADSRQKHDGDPYAYTKVEAVKSAWKYYIPATVVGTSTLVCIFGTNVLNNHSQASIASAYALINESYRDYKNKVKEIYGEEAHQNIINSIMAEKTEEMYISAGNFCGKTSLSFDERNPEDIRTFYDSFSKRYFECTVAQVLEAEYHLNRNWVLGADICINDFYDFLGLSTIEGGDELRWFWSDGMGWIDFDHHKTVLDDGMEIYVIDLDWLPRLENSEYDE